MAKAKPVSPRAKRALTSIIDRAKAQKVQAARRQCRVCTNPRVREDTVTLLKAWAAGDLGLYSLTAMRDVLVETHTGLEMGRDALRRHLRDHEPELWKLVEGIR